MTLKVEKSFLTFLATKMSKMSQQKSQSYHSHIFKSATNDDAASRTLAGAKERTVLLSEDMSWEIKPDEL